MQISRYYMLSIKMFCCFCRFDVVTGQRRGSVINTKSFGGQCRIMFSGVNRFHYRLPLSIIKYNTLVRTSGTTYVL